MQTPLSNPTLWDIDPGPDCPAVTQLVVEIGKNSSNRYEYDPRLRLFQLDRAALLADALPRRRWFYSRDDCG
jgi:inorganic pyrophosphatase